MTLTILYTLRVPDRSRLYILMSVAQLSIIAAILRVISRIDVDLRLAYSVGLGLPAYAMYRLRLVILGLVGVRDPKRYLGVRVEGFYEDNPETLSVPSSSSRSAPFGEDSGSLYRLGVL